MPTEPEVLPQAESLLLEPMPMQAPAAPYIEMTTGDMPIEPEYRLATGPPPPPQGYDPRGAGYMASGPSYLTTAQEVPFALVYPGYPQAG